MTEIYLDSAATSLHKPPQVARAVAEAICTAGNAARGAHGASMAASRTVYDTRCLAARLLGCPRPDHVAFTANSTMALNMAICGLLTPEDHAISTDLEHNSVLRPLYALQRQGMGLSFLPADGNGRLDYDALEGLFRPNTRAVVCTHASNVTGAITPLDAVLPAARAARVEPLEQVIDKLKEEMRTRHILRMRQGQCSIEAGFVWADLLTDLERTSDHCSNIAGCVIDAARHNLNLHETLRAAQTQDPDFAGRFRDYAQTYRLPEGE